MPEATCRWCPQPKEKPYHFCTECRLTRAPMDDQVAAALNRRHAAEEANTNFNTVKKEEWTVGRRWCSGCYSMRRFDTDRQKFDVAPSSSRCRACLVADRRRGNFKLTTQDQSAIMLMQGNRCGACGNASRTKSLAVDHIHGTEFVRGYLDSRCNHDIIGAAKESVDILADVVCYLLSPPGLRAVEQPGAPAAMTYEQAVVWFSQHAHEWFNRKVDAPRVKDFDPADRSDHLDFYQNPLKYQTQLHPEDPPF